jgi:RND superfamily putative drug exporter
MDSHPSAHNVAARMARWSSRHRKKAFWGWLVFVILAFALGNAVGPNNISDIDNFNGESHDAEAALDRAGLRPQSEVVFIQSDTLTIEDPQFKAAVADVTGRLPKIPYVENVKSPLRGESAVSEDGHAAVVNFEVAGDSNEAKDRIDPVLAAVAAAQKRHPELAVEQIGDASANKAINEVFGEDLEKAGMLSLPVTLILLVIAFGTLVAASVPLWIGLSAVAATLGLVNLPSQILPIDTNLPAVILLIGLAVGVDYSLFYLKREREERAAGRSETAALEAAAATSGRAVLISGATVMVAMAGMFISGDNTFISFGMGTILVVAVAVLACLTVLPAMLSWLRDRVQKGRVPILGRRRRGVGESRFWSSLTGAVMRRPLVSLLVAGGALVALAIPALGLKSVTSGVDELPNDIPVIQTYNKVKKTFPQEGVTATVVMEVPDVKAGAPSEAIAALTDRVDKNPQLFKPGTELIESDDDTVAQINIPTIGTGTDQASLDALNKLRDEIVPATVGAVNGATVNVTGDAASSEDFRTNLENRLPLIFAFVFGLAFLLMLVTFRSIVIPIKAILLNLLSVGAAYGILVLVFQNGNGESILGFTSNGGVTNWLPLFLFVILFGLSMDYHVFILSRVRELHERGWSTDDAVRRGIATTAGTVSSAAAVMVAVFLVFVTLTFLDFKEMGLGLAAAVLIDATLIRGVMLPAAMNLLGDWNWYLPSWLEWLPHAGGEGDMPDGPPEPIDVEEPPKPEDAGASGEPHPEPVPA